MLLARRIVALNPSKAEYHRILGCYYGFQGDYVSSLWNIENALKIEYNPNWLEDEVLVYSVDKLGIKRVVIESDTT